MRPAQEQLDFSISDLASQSTSVRPSLSRKVLQPMEKIGGRNSVLGTDGLLEEYLLHVTVPAKLFSV